MGARAWKAGLGGRRLRAALILFVLLALVVTIATLRLRERLAPPAVAEIPPLRVETQQLVPEPFVRTVRYYGTVEAEQRAMLAARVASTVSTLLVREGDPVEQGQHLMQLDGEELRQELRRLNAAEARIRADLEFWQAQLKVDRRLFKEGTITERAYEESRRQVASLEATLEENRHAQHGARTRLGYTEITAPFSGIVQSVAVEQGETVNLGKPLLDLVARTSLVARVSAPQVDLALLRQDQRAELWTSYTQGSWDTRLSRIYPALENRTRTLTLELPIPDEAAEVLRPGMSVVVEVELERSEDALQVPLQALRQRQGQSGVFVLDQGQAHWRLVKAGAIQDGRVRLLQGVTAGEQVIITPHPALETGRAVEAQPAAGRSA